KELRAPTRKQVPMHGASVGGRTELLKPKSLFVHQSINSSIHEWLGLLAVFLKFLHEHFRVAATLIVFLAPAGWEIVRRTFGKAAFGLEISKSLRGKSE